MYHNRLVEALRVPLVDRLASTRGAALSTRKALSTALSVQGRAASLSGRLSSDWNGDQSGGLGSGCGGDFFLGRSGRLRATGASSSTSPNGWSWHGESLATVIDAEVGIGIGGLVCAGELCSVSHRLNLTLTVLLTFTMGPGVPLPPP
jgi:hypothetical protein